MINFKLILSITLNNNTGTYNIIKSTDYILLTLLSLTFFKKSFLIFAIL